MKIALMSRLLKPGVPAPPFRLLDQSARSVGLSDYTDHHRGVALLFFSGPWRPGDRAFLQSYAAAWPCFQQEGIALLALSATDWEAAHSFHQHLNLPFPLLYDVACLAARRYGATIIPQYITARAVFGIRADGLIAFSAKSAAPNTVLQAFSSIAEG